MTTDLDIDLLARTFEAASEAEPDLVHRFYARFTSSYPLAAKLLGTEVGVHQQQMLMRALGAGVAHLDDPVWLVQTLPHLGRMHAEWGVEPEMYTWFSECLIEELRLAVGADWDDECELHWGAALTLISTLMISGADDSEE